MRVSGSLSMTLLALALSVGPAQALEAPVAFQRDGTYFHSIHAQLLARQGQARADSTESPKAMYVLGGGALVGLAAYFVSSANGSSQPTFPGLPSPLPQGDDDILLPSPGPTAPWGPPTGTSDPQGGPSNNPGGTSPGLDVPVTVTPEPVSMALLASGLAGLGGASLRRRFPKT